MARNAEDAADATQGSAFVIGAQDLLLAVGMVSGGVGGIVNEGTPAIVAAVALLALGGVSVSYGVGASAMATGSSLRIHVFYNTSTTFIGPLPRFL